MSVLVMDSFDWNGATIINNRYLTVSGAPSFSNAQTKHGTGYSLLINSASEYVHYDIGTQTGNIVVIGFYIYNTVLYSSADTYILYLYGDASLQCCLCIDQSTRKLKIYRGTVNLLGTGSQTIQLNTWYHIEWRIKVVNSTAANECILKVDGVVDLDLVGVDTQDVGSNLFNKVIFGSSRASTFYYDDFYVLDTVGSYANDFIGPHIRIECLKPNGNGNSNDFVGSDADSVDNYLHVDETVADDDTTYVESSTVSNKDSYAFEDLSGNVNSIMAVQTMTRHKKDASGSRTVKHFIRSGGSDYDGDVEHTLSSGTYENDIDLWLEDPDTVSQWTESGVNSMEAGIKVQS